MNKISLTSLFSNPFFGYQTAENFGGYFGLFANYYRNFTGYYRFYWYS